MTTTDLYPYLILVGGSILIATAWLLYRARTQTQLGQELVRLNEELRFDLPNFLRQCWPVLAAGGFSGLRWEMNWFGSIINGSEGKATNRDIGQVFQVPEIGLTINLFQRKHGWEQRYFSSVLAEKLFLLVRMDMWIKLGTVRGTFDQTAKLTVFLQHDMKNLLQLISLAADQLESIEAGTESKILASLQLTVPATRDRAIHMLKALVGDAGSGDPVAISLADQLKQSSAMYELPVTINGDAIASVREDSLHSIIENLLGNYASLARSGNSPVELMINIAKDGNSALMTIEDTNGKPCLWPERLFEPFWSEHGRGRGIGLYQARQLAIASGGEISVRAPTDGPLKFIVSLPV